MCVQLKNIYIERVTFTGNTILEQKTPFNSFTALAFVIFAVKSPE